MSTFDGPIALAHYTNATTVARATAYSPAAVDRAATFIPRSKQAYAA